MRYLKALAAVAALLVVSACKIQISVPESGGRVASANVACEAGEQCDLVVETPDFNELFVAEPDPGYEFIGWRQEASYLCGGSTEPCTVSTLFFAGNPTLLSLLTLDVNYFLEPIFICRLDSLGNPVAECGVREDPVTIGRVTGVEDVGVFDYAQVVVTIDGFSFLTRVRADGSFSLGTLFGGDALVEIVVSYPDSAGGVITLASLAGTADQVMAQEEVAVSPLTTARYGLAAFANNGAVPTNAAEIYAAESATDPEDLLNLAAAVTLLVNRSDVSLPAGVEDLLELVSDRDLSDAFLDTINDADPQLLQDVAAELDAKRFTPTGIAGRYLAIAPSIPGYLSRFGELIDLSGADQTGAVRGSDPLGRVYSNEVTWQVADGDLVLTYTSGSTGGTLFSAAETSATPEQLVLLEAEENGFGGFYPYTDTLLDDTYSLLETGVFVEFANRERRSNRSFLPVTLSSTTGDTIQLPDSLTSDPSIESLRAENGITPIAFTESCTSGSDAPCVPGTWGGLFFYSPGNDSNGEPVPVGSFADVLTFSTDGTATGDISGQTVGWSVQDGKLILSYADGWSQTVTLVQRVGVEYGALVEYSRGAESFADYNVYVKRDENLTIDLALVTNPEGRFWVSDISASAPGVIFDRQGVRKPGSIFGFSFYNIDGEQVGFNTFARFRGGEFSGFFENPLTWFLELEPDRVVFNRNPGRDRARYFYPLAADVSSEGRRLFGVEYEVVNFFAPNFVQIPPRTTIYTETDLPLDQ